MGYSQLTGSLFQGSRPPTGVRMPFDVIVLAAQEYQPPMPGFHVVRVPILDASPSLLDRQRIRVAAHEVAARLRTGQRVLVTCNQGRNRSGVIAGLALVELGMPPREAVYRIRKERNGLTNPYFLEMVLSGG